MASGAAAGVVRVPNLGTGPLLIITGNVANPGIPTSSVTFFNGGTASYIKALMWEANGFTRWNFAAISPAGGSFSNGAATNGITVWGTNDANTRDGTASNWFKLDVDIGGTAGPTPANPMLTSGTSFEYHGPLTAIAVTTGGLLSGPWNFFATARD